MGICCSTGKQGKTESSPPPPQPPPEVPSSSPPPLCPASTTAPLSGMDAPPPAAFDAPPPAASDTKTGETCNIKKPLFLVAPSKTKRSPSAGHPAGESNPDALLAAAPLRTSSCTKEEVESILIQCGRLSRSSSGNADSNGRRYSGSKRSFDFDAEKKDGEDWERSVPCSSSRPSPRRRAQSRERDSGSRRVSRSPARRTEQTALPLQPGKLVSVPAREKSAAPGEKQTTRCLGNGNGAPVRSSSPRSRSPGMVRASSKENCRHAQSGGDPPLSRSSSRKAEQSPYRRNPMEEMDENCFSGDGNHHPPENPKKKVAPPPIVGHQRTARAQQREEGGGVLEEKAKPITAISRSSRDFEGKLPPPSSYTSLLLEDIHNYHHQKQGTSAGTIPAFTLPACVSKACSILEAVADLNREEGFSSNGRQVGSAVKQSSCGTAAAAAEEEEEAEVEDRYKYVSLRKKSAAPVDSEPQESAGSNSFVVGRQQWEEEEEASANLDGDDSSSSRCWTSSRSVQEEAEGFSVQKGGGGSRSSGRRTELEKHRRSRRGLSCSSAPAAVAAS